MNNGKRAIIAGIAGQDGSYLAELLIEKGYKVLGFLKKGDDTSVLSHLMKEIVLEETELVRKEDIIRWARIFSPDEIYNFAALSLTIAANPGSIRHRPPRSSATPRTTISSPPGNRTA